MDIINVVLLFMVVSVVITILLIHSVPAWTCAASLAPRKEGFETMPDVKTCPYGSKEFIDKKDNILCCDGNVEGRTCMGEVLCRFSPASGPDSPAFCADYVASQAFKPSASLIQNPDTDMCVSPSRDNIIYMTKCDGGDSNQHWTYNKLGQLIHDKTGRCMTQQNGQPGIRYYALEQCGIQDKQTFKYDYKHNHLSCNASANSPLFVQDFPDVGGGLLLTTMSDDQIRADFGSKDESKMIKNIFYTHRDKPERTTFLSVKPTVQDTLKNLKSVFGGKL